MNLIQQMTSAFAPKRGVHDVIEDAMFRARNSTGKEAREAMNTVTLLLFYNKEVIDPRKAEALKDEIRTLRANLEKAQQ